MTLRQLYYQCIARDLFPSSWIDEAYNRKNGLPADTKNTERSYKKLGDLISNARDAGLIDWSYMRDLARSMSHPPSWETPNDILHSAASGFRLDLWENQPNSVYVMVEKQALEGVLSPVCGRLRVPFTSNKGYASASHFYDIGKQIANDDAVGRYAHVIYLGDHDPSGMDMGRDVQERLELYSRTDVHFHRIALNMDQIRAYNPPPNPAKTTDSRAAGYIDQYGNESWELDALTPDQLATLVTETVDNLRDDEIWAEDVKRENNFRRQLTELADTHVFS